MTTTIPTPDNILVTRPHYVTGQIHVQVRRSYTPIADELLALGDPRITEIRVSPDRVVVGERHGLPVHGPGVGTDARAEIDSAIAQLRAVWGDLPVQDHTTATGATAETMIETMRRLLAECEAEARRQGWEGDYGRELTAEECEHIATGARHIHGRRPTREEWAEIGMRRIGGQHLESDDGSR